MIKTTLSSFAKSIGFNSQNYIPKEGASFSLFRIEVLSGLTVALALVPEAIAFAFVAGVAPLSGLYAAFIVGLITAVFGGRPGMISGATGALAVVMVSLVMDHGAQYLFATVVLMGILQLLAGVFKLGKFIRMVPQPVMLGFVNGLAIVIGISQLSQFKTLNTMGQSVWISGNTLYYSIGFVVLTPFKRSFPLIVASTVVFDSKRTLYHLPVDLITKPCICQKYFTYGSLKRKETK